MDIKTLLNNLHEEVSCSVCMTTFTDPKMLPCLHSFCLHCLTGILRTSGRHDVVACPECRRESKVPSSGNLKDLPTNFRINSLLDVLAIKECNRQVQKSDRINSDRPVRVGLTRIDSDHEKENIKLEKAETFTYLKAKVPVNNGPN